MKCEEPGKPGKPGYPISETTILEGAPPIPVSHQGHWYEGSLGGGTGVGGSPQPKASTTKRQKESTTPPRNKDEDDEKRKPKQVTLKPPSRKDKPVRMKRKPPDKKIDVSKNHKIDQMFKKQKKEEYTTLVPEQKEALSNMDKEPIYNQEKDTVAVNSLTSSSLICSNLTQTWQHPYGNDHLTVDKIPDPENDFPLPDLAGAQNGAAK